MSGKGLDTVKSGPLRHGNPDNNHNRTQESAENTIILYVPIIALIGCFFMRFLFHTWSSWIKQQRLKISIRHTCQNLFSASTYTKATLNRHLFYAPLFRRRHNREFRICQGRIHMGGIPTRIETLLIGLYSGLNFAFCVIPISWSKGTSHSLHMLIETTGSLAVVNLIPLVITAGRNNPFIPILQLSFDTFNLVHRWIGRIIVVEAIAHAFAVIGRLSLERGWTSVAEHFSQVPIFTYGLVAAACFTIIFIQSLSPLRHAFYEFFLHSHIVLVAVSFAMLWCHLHEFDQRWMLLSAVIAWGIDRMVRMLIVIWRNCGKTLTTATIQILPGEVARVDIDVVRPWKFNAGQYIYLYIPALGLWTSHPFSVAWQSTEQHLTLNHMEATPDTSGSSSTKSILSADIRERTNKTMSLLIRKREGFTSKIFKSVGRVPGYQRRFFALTEGPFGGMHSFNSYGSVLLVAGGIGITHSISYLRDLIDGFANGSVATRRISLLWVVRSIDHLQWIEPWMTHILTHPVVQGAITFPKASFDASCWSPFSLENDIHSHNRLSFSVNIHLTTYYSSSPSLNILSDDPSSATCSSLTSDKEKVSNNNSRYCHDSFDTKHATTRDTELFSNGSASFDRPPHQSYQFRSPASNRASSCSTIFNTINDYYATDEISTPLPNTEAHSPSPGSILVSNDNDSSFNDWTQRGTLRTPITMNLGKPLFRQVLEREMAQQIGAMAVSVCGPGGMGDEVRKAVRDVQDRKFVDLFEESFSW